MVPENTQRKRKEFLSKGKGCIRKMFGTVNTDKGTLSSKKHFSYARTLHSSFGLTEHHLSSYSFLGEDWRLALGKRDGRGGKPSLSGFWKLFQRACLPAPGSLNVNSSWERAECPTSENRVGKIAWVADEWMQNAGNSHTE